MDSINTARALIVNGRLYKLVTNAGRGDYYHRHYQKLAAEGMPIIIRRNAYAGNNALVKSAVAIFVEEESRDQVREAIDLATAGELESARFEADQGFPTLAFEYLAKSDADEATKRTVLAEAYRKLARISNRTAANLRNKGFDEGAKIWRREAGGDYRFARRLLSGKAPLGVAPKTVNPELINTLFLL